mmetsp:Transcript_11612/g.43019  ORF Transcript_11612/g.43019 Transcript_11612/m.43019 type:complete len:224 (+) Transcript_11612:371-1042(+)
MLNPTIHKQYAPFALRRDTGSTSTWHASAAAQKKAHTPTSFASHRQAQTHPPSAVSCGSARPPGAEVTTEIRFSLSNLSTACRKRCRFVAVTACASAAVASLCFSEALARNSPPDGNSFACCAAASAISRARVAFCTSDSSSAFTAFLASRPAFTKLVSIQTPIPTPRKNKPTYPGREKIPSLFWLTKESPRGSAKTQWPRVSCAHGLALPSPTPTSFRNSVR